MIHPSIPAALLALSLALAAQPAGATISDDPPDESGQTEAAPDPTGAPDDAELNNFVHAFVRLIGVQHGYLMLLREETDPVRSEQLKADALTEMRAAVQQDGMSIDRYNAIATRLRTDSQLQGRVEGLIQQMAETPDDGEE